MLALLTCSTSPVDDYDYDYDYAASMRRRNAGKNFMKFGSPRVRRRKSAGGMVIGSPTNFRHEVHLGRELKADHSYLLWDIERWREELAKRDLILPPVKLPETPTTSTSTTFEPKRHNCSKRSSFTPQKRKPVPSLDPDVPRPSLSQPSPQDVPLPPSPSSHSSDSESVPALDPPSRGPSIDGASLPESVEKPWVDEARGEKTMDPALEPLHADPETTLQPQL